MINTTTPDPPWDDSDLKPTKGTVLYDVYTSMIVDISSSYPTSSTDKDNTNNNQLKETGMIALDPINIYLTKSEISINPPKIDHGSTHWSLVPLETTLIYNTKERNIIM